MSSLKATVLEEMPPFPERESSILAKLKKKKKEKAGILDKEEKSEPVEKPTTNGQVPVANEVYACTVMLLGHISYVISQPTPTNRVCEQCTTMTSDTTLSKPRYLWHW